MNTVRYQYDLDDPLVYKNEMGRYKTERQLSFIRRFLSRESMALLDIGGGGQVGIGYVDEAESGGALLSRRIPSGR